MDRSQLRLVLCAALVALGCVTAAGWLWQVEILTSVLPGASTMKFNTALGFILVGGGIAAAPGSTPSLQIAARLCGALVLLLGAATLAQYELGLDLGIDQAAIADHGSLRGSGHPGRMSPLTAITFAALGTAVLLLAGNGRRTSLVAAHLLGGFAAFTAFFAAAGYAFGARAFHGIGVYTAIAFHTALGLAIAAAAILMTRSAEGWLRDFSEAPGARALLRRMLRTAFILPFALGVVLLLGSGLGLFDAPFGFALYAPATAVALVWQALRVARAARHHERALLRREAQLSAFFAQSQAGIVQTDLEGCITIVNDCFCTILGRTREELCGRTWRDITHPDDREGNASLFRRGIAEGVSYTHEKRYLRPDGTPVWVHLSVSPLRQPSGEPYGVLGVMLDVTEQRAIQHAVRENEARLRALTDNLPGGMVFQILTGIDGTERRFIYLSESFTTLTGIPAERIAEDPQLPYRLIAPEDVPRLADAEAAAVAALQPLDIELRFRRADGTLRWSRIISAPRAQPDGGLIWDGLMIDISREKHAEEALRDSERRLNTALAIAEVGAFEWQLPDILIHFDARARALFGFEPDEPVTPEQLLARIVDPDDVVRQLDQAERNRSRLSMEYAVRHPDGSEHILTSLSDVVPGADGKPDRLVGVLADVTERNRVAAEMARFTESLETRVAARTQELEQVNEQLRQAQKLEAMGQLTGGVAHDFNNLLTPIIGSLDLLRHRGVGTEREQRLIGAALDSAERAKTLVQRLLAFARRQPLQAGPVQLDTLAAGMAELIASTSGPQVRLVVDIPAELPPVQADANQLEMAILNLCVNARDAMPDGGTLTLSAEAEEVGPGHASKLPPARYVRLSIADTGTGMDADTIAKAVEPFFSTKGVGRGTGLGLSMAHGLASQLGGALLIHSRVGLGTRIDLYLPLATAPAHPGETALSGAPPKGAGTILLVDDEEPVRATTAEVLRELGYAVVEAGSAQQALETLRRERIDALLTDHLMPGMKGSDLARKVRAEYPGMPTLVVSGYADLEDVSPDLPRLAKPFRQEELAATMARLMRDLRPAA